MKFRSIPQFTFSGNYAVDTSWDYVLDWIKRKQEQMGAKFEIDPDFQRGHVWTEDKQIAYVEFCLRGGTSANSIYWNCVGWMDSFEGPFVLVDGKQRLTAVQRFLNNEIKAFDCLYKDYEDSLPSNVGFKMHVNNLKTRKQVLNWYLEMNSGGVVHTQEELDKVRELLACT